MFWLESCPRCHGDLSGSIDNYGSFVNCMQCGHYLSDAEESELKSEPPSNETSSFPIAERLNSTKFPAA